VATLAHVELLAGALEEREALSPWAGALARAAGSEPTEVAAAQQRLFGGQVSVPPYEGSYEPDPFRQARAMADVAGFYRAFGVDAHGPEGDRADHAGAELEFLAFVEERRLEAETGGRADDAAACAEAARLFLAEHAGRWLPTFFGSLAATAGDAFHLSLGGLGAAVVADVLAVHAVDVPTVAARAPRLPVEADELTCAAGDEAVLPGLAG
jgi:TorA maturation chaperone TorD